MRVFSSNRQLLTSCFFPFAARLVAEIFFGFSLL
jgi:hypothetical protein